MGSPGTETEDTVSGWTTNPVGGFVCNSGAYSGTVCDLEINNNNECIYLKDLGREVCHFIHAVSRNDAVANESGDSGGPVYQVTNGDFYAAGIDSASTTADTTQCQYNIESTIHCYTDIFYSAMDSVLSAFNATIIVG